MNLSTHSVSSVEFSDIPLLFLPDGQSIEVEFDADESAVEISLVESCGAVAGSVFIPVDQVSNLIQQLRRAIPK